MESEEVLGNECRRMVDEFIESLLDDVELSDMERNVLGVDIREDEPAP